LIERGGVKLQDLLDEAGAHPLHLSLEEERVLLDWDSPEDMKDGQR
jgi:hypothetical protein